MEYGIRVYNQTTGMDEILPTRFNDRAMVHDVAARMRKGGAENVKVIRFEKKGGE